MPQQQASSRRGERAQKTTLICIFINTHLLKRGKGVEFYLSHFKECTHGNKCVIVKNKDEFVGV